MPTPLDTIAGLPVKHWDEDASVRLYQAHQGSIKHKQCWDNIKRLVLDDYVLNDDIYLRVAIGALDVGCHNPLIMHAFLWDKRTERVIDPTLVTGGAPGCEPRYLISRTYTGREYCGALAKAVTPDPFGCPSMRRSIAVLKRMLNDHCIALIG